jgi:hypothetical protein
MTDSETDGAVGLTTADEPAKSPRRYLLQLIAVTLVIAGLGLSAAVEILRSRAELRAAWVVHSAVNLYYRGIPGDADSAGPAVDRAERLERWRRAVIDECGLPPESVHDSINADRAPQLHIALDDPWVGDVTIAGVWLVDDLRTDGPATLIGIGLAGLLAGIGCLIAGALLVAHLRRQLTLIRIGAAPMSISPARIAILFLILGVGASGAVGMVVDRWHRAPAHTRGTVRPIADAAAAGATRDEIRRVAQSELPGLLNDALIVPGRTPDDAPSVFFYSWSPLVSTREGHQSRPWTEVTLTTWLLLGIAIATAVTGLILLGVVAWISGRPRKAMAMGTSNRGSGPGVTA